MSPSCDLSHPKSNKNIDIFKADVSRRNEAKELVEYTLKKYGEIDILINNAGLGDFGYLTDTDLNKDLELINTNIKAVHILTKYIVKDMESRNTESYILNNEFTESKQIVENPNEILEKSRTLDSCIEQLRDYGMKLSSAEKDYKITLRQEALKLREDNLLQKIF